MSCCSQTKKWLKGRIFHLARVILAVARATLKKQKRFYTQQDQLWILLSDRGRCVAKVCVGEQLCAGDAARSHLPRDQRKPALQSTGESPAHNWCDWRFHKYHTLLRRWKVDSPSSWQIFEPYLKIFSKVLATYTQLHASISPLFILSSRLKVILQQKPVRWHVL